MTRYKLLLFDADNTLFDFDRAMRVSISRCLDMFKVQCRGEMLDAYAAINAKYWALYENGKLSRPYMQKKRFAEFMDKFGIEEDPEKFDSLYIENLADCPYVYDGAERLCAELSKYYRMAIITNGIPYMQKKRIRASSVSNYFENIIVSDAAGAAKPEKRFFDYVFKVYGDVERDKALVIGDSLGTDIAGGINSGIPVCWLNHGGRAQSESACPRGKINYEIHNLDGLYKLLLGG